MTLSALKKEDYLRLKWHFVLLVLSLALAGGAFAFSTQLQNEATRQLNIARSDMNGAQSRLEQLEQEGDMLGRYRERYREIEATGISRPGDRLAMQENFAQIRSRFNLFPIQLQIGGQSAFVLPYDPSVQDPGAPVLLLTSEIVAALPLLHEDDLTNLLASLQDSDDLLLATGCSLQTSNRNARDYLQLGQHLNASCNFLWYTFQVQEATQ
jgi:hypothetical protein